MAVYIAAWLSVTGLQAYQAYSKFLSYHGMWISPV